MQGNPHTCLDVLVKIMYNKSGKNMNNFHNVQNTFNRRQELTMTRDQISSFDTKNSDTQLTENDDSIKADLNHEDIVVEVCGGNIPKINNSRLEYPVMTMEMREAQEDLDVLAEDLVLIQEIIQRRITQEKRMKKRLEKEQKECTKLRQENKKLEDRIAFLEDQSEYLQKTMRQVADFL